MTEKKYDNLTARIFDSSAESGRSGSAAGSSR